MANAAEFDEVLGHLAHGRLKPVVDSVTGFDLAAQAFRRFDAPDLFGKVVVSVSEP